MAEAWEWSLQRCRSCASAGWIGQPQRSKWPRLTRFKLLGWLVVILGLGWSGLFLGPLPVQAAFFPNSSPAQASVQPAPGVMRSARIPTQEVIQDSVSHLPEGHSEATMPPDMQRIFERGTLLVALLDSDNPPFFAEDEGDRLQGLDVDMARDLANRLGVGLQFNRSATTFNEVVDVVFKHEADLAISKLSRTLPRAKRVRFSAPYLSMRHGLLINRLRLAQLTQGRSVPETIRQLEGQVGVIQGSSYVGFLKQKFPAATVVEFLDWESAVEAVTQGAIVAAYRDELEVKKVILNHPDAALALQTIALTDTEDPIAMVLPWDSTHLLSFLDQYLETEQLNYTADRVLQDYSR